MSEVYDQLVSNDANDGTHNDGGFLSVTGTAYLWVGNGQTGFFRFLNVPMSQGATIDSAYLKVWTQEFGSSNPVQLKVRATAEDNAAALPASNGTNTDPKGRPRTSAGVDFDFDGTRNVQRTSPDIKTVIQEIVDRPGWAGGNAILIALENDGSPFQNDLFSYAGNSAKAAELIINYTGITTSQRTLQATARIDNPMRDVGIKIMKPTYDVLRDNNPAHQIFNSDFGTLKYAVSGSLDVVLAESFFGATGYIEHNLGYKPYVEVYVEDLQSPGQFYYCPGYEAGATVFWGTTYRITNTRLQFYVESSGFFSDQTFRFHYFIFKNDLQL